MPTSSVLASFNRAHASNAEPKFDAERESAERDVRYAFAVVSKFVYAVWEASRSLVERWRCVFCGGGGRGRLYVLKRGLDVLA